MLRRHYKFFIAAMGPGEIGQGTAFAKYALSRGDSVVFSVPHRNYLPLIELSHQRFSYLVAKNSNILKKALAAKKPDVLVLCNSKIFTKKDNFHIFPPNPKPPTISIDSNWLFSPSSPYISNSWVDLYCLNFPKPIFDLGLKKNGGNYSIPLKVLKKIRVVGLIPSLYPITKNEKIKIRRQYGIKKEEKLIFLYASIGYLQKPNVFLKAYGVAKKIREKGHNIKMIYFGDRPKTALNKADHQWFLIKPRVSADHFSKVLMSSDLVFQHQGLSTLEQAIGAQVPVISNVRNVLDEKNPLTHRHAWEVGPFARYGACAMFFVKDPLETAVDCVENLLFDKKCRKKMIDKQKSLYSNGEANAYTEAIKLLKNKQI